MNGSKYDAWEQYEDYAYEDNSREARRHRRGRDHSPTARRRRRHEAKRMAQMSDRVESFVPTYVQNLDPQHHERQWVIDSVAPFYSNSQISDVLRLVKGGKEANVYLCQAHPRTGHDLLAAKLYRPRMLRHLKNNALYKEGRFLRDEQGKLLLGSREARAMASKTRFGQQLDLAAWIVHEYEIQSQLYEAGADVPRPVAYGGNTILMEYLGGAVLPAPLLDEITLAPEAAQPLFERLLYNVELMLAHHLVHADLSAYNILYWEGELTIIDFPQVVDARTNPNAFSLLQRDMQRVYDYFAGYGVQADARGLAHTLWERYMRAEL